MTPKALEDLQRMLDIAQASASMIKNNLNEIESNIKDNNEPTSIFTATKKIKDASKTLESTVDIIDHISQGYNDDYCRRS